MTRNLMSLRVTLAWMVITGAWLPKALENSPYKLLYYIYATFFQIILFFGIIVIQFLYLHTVYDDIEKAANASLLLFTHISQVSKIATIWARRSRIKGIMDVLESPDFNRDEVEKKAIIESSAEATYKANMFTISLTLIASILWCTRPIFLSTLPVNYPDISTNSLMFTVVAVYQFLAIILSAVGDAAEDGLIGGLMILASGQLDVLYYELNQIGEHSATEKDDNTDTDYEKAVACVKYHQKIISFIKELDNIFGLPVFCQFAASCLILCLIAFRMSNSKDPSEILNLSFYLVCILSELLLFCFTGNIILYKSQTIAEAAYCCCGWTNSSLRTRQTLVMIIQRAQRPLTLTAGKKFNLSLETFTSILKSSYSYFAVLNSNDK